MNVGGQVPQHRAAGRGEARRAAILEAAIDEFAANGIRGASMARIAEAAGVSRPALYQYFDGKDEIFASAFIGLFERLVDGAVQELNGSGSTAERLNRFLQRYEGDLFERMSASPHVDEIIGAKNDQLAAAVAEVVARLSHELGAHLDSTTSDSSSEHRSQHAGSVEMLRLAPKGFRFDQPSVAEFRRRLTQLADVVGAAVDAH